MSACRSNRSRRPSGYAVSRRRVPPNQPTRPRPLPRRPNRKYRNRSPFMRADLDELETAAGYQFSDREILRRALTHSSHVHEQVLVGGQATARDNEQFEFLGDSVLGFLISEDLLQRHPESAEGRLSKLKAHLVSAAWLHEAAQRLRLGEYLELGRGEEMSGGRSKKTLLVDAFEAVIAAIYLDGGIEPVREFIQCFVVEPGIAQSGPAGELLPQNLIDYKS